MRPSRFTAALGLTAVLAAAASAEERNAWPFWVGQVRETPAATAPETRAPGSEIESWTSAGPFLFSRPAIHAAPARTDLPTTIGGLRPLYVQETDTAGKITEIYVLPPLFRYTSTPFGSRWKIFSLINREYPSENHVAGVSRERTAFEVWPFYLSRQTGSAATSYHALFPIYGSVKYRFGLDRWTWVIFPLYGRFEKNGVTTTTAPWPFLKIMRGEGNRGFELWPLFGKREKAGEYREQFYLWPLIYKNEKKLSEPQPDVRAGFLPFYASTIDADSQSKTYLWPFFGWFDRTAPVRYHESRYFWPLLVQGRGDGRYVNRWAPFYTFSSSKGVEKTWILWPLWRQTVSDEGSLIQTKRQFLYFLYNDTEQRSATNPAARHARKTHVWPLFTWWNNGAGRRQLQALDPLEVFLPHNEMIRVVYSPLFALYRYDQPSPDESRHSLLWNFITLHRAPQTTEFHLGPLLGFEKHAREKRVELLGGVIGADRSAARGWRPFLFKFKRRVTPAATSGATRAESP